MKQILQILFLIVPVAIFAQDYPLTGHFQNLNEEDIYYKNNSTLIRPATGCENEVYDSLIFTTTLDTTDRSWINRKLFHEHLLVQEDSLFKLLLDPIIDFRANKSIDGFYNPSSIGYLNTRGILISGNLDSKVFFNTSFFENQGVFSDHIFKYYDTYGVIPGYGRIKPLSNQNEYDFAAAYGNISLKATKSLDFTIGYDRLFIGDGYRSMILSDFAAPMMYFKTSAKFGKFEYNSIFTKALNPNFNNVSNLPETTSINSRYPAKFISYNTLTYKIKNWQFSVIEALVMPEDLPNWQMGLNYAAPFVRGAFNSLMTEPINDMAGLNISWQIPDFGIFYSQVMIDRLFGSTENDAAFQIGYKDFDFLNVMNWYFLLEYNMATDRAYTFVNNELHYSHYNQPLAHPAGNSFNEFIFLTAYSLKRFEIIAKLNFLKVGTQNIFDFYQTVGYYDTSNSASTAPIIATGDLQIIYNVNTANRLQVFAGVSPRLDLIRNTDDLFIQFGLRTAIRSNYSDF